MSVVIIASYDELIAITPTIQSNPNQVSVFLYKNKLSYCIIDYFND